MSNLEHLIENTLVAMEDDTLCSKDIRERIKNDVNLPHTSLSVDDVLEICTYFMYTWCGTCEKCNGDRSEMNTYELFLKQGRGFYRPVNEMDIRQIISYNPDGTCLWVETPDYYMEVDCPDSDNMNARFEADGKIINKSFPYNYEGFIDACDWFDEQRTTYRFAKLIGGE